jgi:MFS family permease
MLPLTVGFLVAGPLSGHLSDRVGARYLATGGTIGAAACFLALTMLPIDFNYAAFATIVLFCGISMGPSPRRTEPPS